MYCEKLASAVLKRYAAGETLTSACAAEGVDLDQFFDWRWELDGAPKDFQLRFEQAQLAFSEQCADRVLEAANSEEVVDPMIPKDLRASHATASKMKMDANRWLAERLNPGRFGPSAQLTLVGNEDAPVVVRQMMDLDRAMRVLEIVKSTQGEEPNNDVSAPAVEHTH